VPQRQPSLEGDSRPDQFDNAEGPGTLQEPIDGGDNAPSGEGENEPMTAMFERIEHEHRLSDSKPNRVRPSSYMLAGWLYSRSRT
jgi:hypothetical protein